MGDYSDTPLLRLPFSNRHLPRVREGLWTVIPGHKVRHQEWLPVPSVGHPGPEAQAVQCLETRSIGVGTRQSQFLQVGTPA